MLFSAHASLVLSDYSPLQSGTVRDCTWKYERIDDEIVLTIAPSPRLTSANEEQGSMLHSIIYPATIFQWVASQYREDTRRIVVKEGVKLPSSASPILTFGSFHRVKSMDLSGLNVADVTSMRGMFSQCSSLTSLDVSGWDVSHVTDMEGMFSQCPALTSLNLSGWNVSAVTNMKFMFSQCSSLTSLDVSGWDVSHVTNMKFMFSECSSLTSLDVSGWDVSHVTDMKFMFSKCRALTLLDVSEWDVSHVTDMESMFSKCRALISLDVSGWDVSKATDMTRMFSDCALASLDVSRWDVSAVKGMRSMFDGCSALASLDVSRWDVSHVTDMYSMFSECSALALLDVSKWDVSHVTDMYSMFSKCSALTSLDVSEWDVSSVESTEHMFSECSVLASLDVSRWDVSHVANMDSMFSECSALALLDVSEWDVSNVGSMEHMFSECSALASLNLSRWDVSGVSNMSSMFSGCSALASLKLSTGKVPNTMRMGDMFKRTKSLRDLTLGINFFINDDASFEDAGSRVGTHWARTVTDSAGNSYSKIFSSAEELRKFHHDRPKRQTSEEHYMRVAPSIAITFDKGSDDVVGTMDLQFFGYHERGTLNENAYKRDGYEFDGWQDDEGNFYTDKQPFINTVPRLNAQKTLTAQWRPKVRATVPTVDVSAIETPILTAHTPTTERSNDVGADAGREREAEKEGVAPSGDAASREDSKKSDGVQEKRGEDEGDQERREETRAGEVRVVLTYLSEDSAKGTVRRSSDELRSDTDIPQGSTALPQEGHEFVKWTKDTDRSWSYEGAELTGDALESAAKRGGKFITTSFTAHFAPKSSVDSGEIPAQTSQPSDRTSAALPQAPGESFPAEPAGTIALSRGVGSGVTRPAITAVSSREAGQAAARPAGETAPSREAGQAAAEPAGETAPSREADEAAAEPAGETAPSHEADEDKKDTQSGGITSRESEKIAKTGDTVSSMLFGFEGLPSGHAMSTVGATSIAIAGAVSMAAAWHRRRKGTCVD